MRGVPGSKAPHGTLTRYSWHGCRCDECRAANRDYYRVYLRAYRAKRRADLQALDPGAAEGDAQAIQRDEATTAAGLDGAA